MAPFRLSASERLLCEGILRTHSITYYNSTKLFPTDIQDAVFALYAWVRIADEIVDNPKSDPKTSLRHFMTTLQNALDTDESSDEVTRIFVRLVRSANFEPRWPKAFLDSMMLDLTHKEYRSREELFCYTYGSAEVIGLMMAQIMGVSASGHHAAQELGKWMQLVNFIRDVDEDWKDRKRIYLPSQVIANYGLNPKTLFSPKHRPQLLHLLRDEAYRLSKQTQELRRGLVHVPRPCRPAIRLSLELYNWTLQQIVRQPSIVFDKQVKPSKRVIIALVLRHYPRSIGRYFR